MLDKLNINKLNIKNKNVVVYVLFAAYFLTGILIFHNYGLSWDENSQWKNNGHANYNFIFHDDKQTLLEGIDKYHGPAFELILVFVEKAFSLTDSRDIFFLRHLITFFVFFISAIFFYLLALKIFKKKSLAIIAFLIYVLSPHIFAHSFYNSKDTVFLSFFVISIYTLVSFYKRQTYLKALGFALITAFTIDIRIIGILIPAILVLLLAIEYVYAIINKNRPEISFKTCIAYFIFLCPLIILFWPVLWIDPVYHFIEALKENSKYPWDGNVLYWGEYYAASKLPWHYLLFWIFISKPIIYSVLFLTGILALLKHFYSEPYCFFKKKPEVLIILIWFFLPLLAIIVFKSTTFDTGRHVYFMHGAFVLIAVYGIEELLKFKNRTFQIAANTILLFSFLNVIVNMVHIHPYQNIYFNECLRNMQKNKNNFELDYWGLSSRKVLESILKKDKSKQIKIYAENYPAKLNVKILTQAEQKRIRITDTIENADYFIADYRWSRSADYPYQKEFYSVIIDGAKICTAFKIRNTDELYNTAGLKLIVNKNNFETKKAHWTNNTITSEKAHSGTFALKVDSTIEYSDNLTIHDLNKISKKAGLILKTSFWCSSSNNNANAKLIISVATSGGKSYIWRSVAEIKGENTNGWKQISGAVELPVINSNSDIIKIYLWNINKTELFIDDIEIELLQEKD